ncbi:MAG: ABC transporter substrate-binding protein [Deinococcota bacterium]
MKKYAVILLLTLLSTGFAQDGFPRTIIDGQGREITLNAPPERVIPYDNSNFGHLATLGVRPIAARVNPEMLGDPIYLPDGADIPRPVVEGTRSELDLEQVASYEPDLIMAWSLDDVAASEIFAPVYLPSRPTTLAGIQDELRNVATMFGLEERAEEAITAFNDRVAAYAAVVEAGAAEVDVTRDMTTDMTIVQLAIRGDGRFYVGSQNDPTCQLLNLIISCTWDNPAGDGWGYNTNIEGALELDPDIIILNSWAADAQGARAEVQQDPLYAEFSAAQNGMVFSTPGYENPISSNLPSAQKMLDTYLPLIFPELFPDGPLTDEQVQEILASQ